MNPQYSVIVRRNSRDGDVKVSGFDAGRSK